MFAPCCDATKGIVSFSVTTRTLLLTLAFGKGSLSALAPHRTSSTFHSPLLSFLSMTHTLSSFYCKLPSFRLLPIVFFFFGCCCCPVVVTSSSSIFYRPSHKNNRRHRSNVFLVSSFRSLSSWLLFLICLCVNPFQLCLSLSSRLVQNGIDTFSFFLILQVFSKSISTRRSRQTVGRARVCAKRSSTVSSLIINIFQEKEKRRPKGEEVRSCFCCCCYC